MLQNERVLAQARILVVCEGAAGVVAAEIPLRTQAQARQVVAEQSFAVDLQIVVDIERRVQVDLGLLIPILQGESAVVDGSAVLPECRLRREVFRVAPLECHIGATCRIFEVSLIAILAKGADDRIVMLCGLRRGSLIVVLLCQVPLIRPDRIALLVLQSADDTEIAERESIADGEAPVRAAAIIVTVPLYSSG